MSNAIATRILRQVRHQIQSGQCRYICFALTHIADHDHRRVVQAICQDLTTKVRAHLGPHKSFGEHLAHTNTPLNTTTVTQARLAWIDRTLETLK